MDKSTPDHRYRYIELIAYWEGSINTGHLCQQFGVSRQQASSDLGRYRDIAPQNLAYCPSRKAYLATPEFTSIYISGDVVEYLNWLQNGYQYQKPGRPSCTSISLNLPQRQVSVQVMRALIKAIRERKRVDVDYVSLNNPNTQGRIIAPHGFVNTGLRWHLRAWCEKSRDYRDFVLSRFRGEPEVLDETDHTAEDDRGWNTQVTVILQPDPRLSAAKREVLERDYQMINGQLQITTKGCLVQYLLRELQVSTKVLDGTPEAQQLVCVNLADIKTWLFEG